ARPWHSGWDGASRTPRARAQRRRQRRGRREGLNGASFSFLLLRNDRILRRADKMRSPNSKGERFMKTRLIVPGALALAFLAAPAPPPPAPASAFRPPFPSS